MNPCNKDVTISYVAGLKINSRCDSLIIRSTNSFRTHAQPDLEQRTARLLQSLRYTPYKCTGPVYSDFPYLSPVMLICIMCRDIFFNHVPARAHRAVEATWSPEMVTTPFLQMRKLLPEHPATSTFDHL